LKRFSELIQQLETSNKTNDKIAALVDYFSNADDRDKPYVIAMLTGKKPKRPVNTHLGNRAQRYPALAFPGKLLQCR